MKADPCEKLFNLWEKAADEAQRAKNEADSGYAFKRYGETYEERQSRAKYEIAKKRAEQLHALLGKCYEKNGMIDLLYSK